MLTTFSILIGFYLSRLPIVAVSRLVFCLASQPKPVKADADEAQDEEPVFEVLRVELFGGKVKGGHD